MIQGAMGVISNPEMVAAVPEAGRFGLLANAFAPDADSDRHQVRATKRLTDKPFGANLQVMNPNTLQVAEALAEERIPAVTISGGSPRALIPLLQEEGIKTLVVLPTVDVARKAARLGADAIVAERSESGGIQGLVGTRLIACRESIAHDKYKSAILESTETGTGLLNLGRFQVRALRTPLVEEFLRSGRIGGGAFGAAGFEASWIEGDLSAGALPAGEVVGLIDEVLSARGILEEMVGAD